MTSWLAGLFHISKLPYLELQIRPQYDQPPTSPAPTYLTRLFNHNGMEVGEADFAISPVSPSHLLMIEFTSARCGSILHGKGKAMGQPSFSICMSNITFPSPQCTSFRVREAFGPSYENAATAKAWLLHRTYVRTISGMSVSDGLTLPLISSASRRLSPIACTYCVSPMRWLRVEDWKTEGRQATTWRAWAYAKASKALKPVNATVSTSCLASCPLSTRLSERPCNSVIIHRC
jgi:hypothetical protein